MKFHWVGYIEGNMKFQDIFRNSSVRVRECLRYLEEFIIYILDSDSSVLYLYPAFRMCLVDMHVTVRHRCQNNLGKQWKWSRVMCCFWVVPVRKRKTSFALGYHNFITPVTVAVTKTHTWRGKRIGTHTEGRI